jgi:YD repeat-containing protein
MKTEVLKHFTAQRKANKNKWFALSVTKDGKTVQLKAYNTWIQRIEITHPDGHTTKDGSPDGMSVKAINEWLNEALA